MEIEKISTRQAYFPNIDGLRFVGSLLIIIFHIESLKQHYGKPTIRFIANYMPVGNMDVSLFFVLSGFLITYLLLKEKKEKGTINMKAYYVRRTLRIWPLYFLVVFIGFFLLPYADTYFNNTYAHNVDKHFWLHLLECVLFLSPLAGVAGGLAQGIGPIWSVGVEEVFYLISPLFLKKTKKYLLLFCFIIILVLVFRNGFFLGSDIIDLQYSNWKIFACLQRLFVFYRFSCMAIGAVGAYLVVFEKNKILTLFYRKDFQWFIYLITIILLLFKFQIYSILEENFPSFSYEMYSVLFMIIIVNLATNPSSIIKLNYRWMTYLGKVSYGLYMFHPTMSIFALELTKHLFKGRDWNWQMNICLYIFTLTLTILIAILSYEFFEKKLLKLKNKFV